MESSSSALVLYHLSKKFKACEAGRFQLLSCEIRYISMSLSQKIEAQRAVLNYERSQGGSGRPKEQNEGDLTCSAVICLSADTGSVERLWCHLPSESSQAGARPSAPLQELFQRQPSTVLAWQSREMQDKVPSQRLLLQQVPSARRRVPELPPSQARAGLFILQTASFLSKPARGTRGNGRVYYKLSKGTDYCWRRSRVIKDWSGGGEEEGTGHNLCLCVRGCRLVASARHSPNPQDLCLVLVGFCAVHTVLCQSPLTFYCINHPLYAAPRLGERLQVLF